MKRENHPVSLKQIPEKQLLDMWNMVYNISLRMLHSPEEAEDATQDIFLKVQNSLPDFRNESHISTWVYSIARNYLLNRKSRHFPKDMSFEVFASDLECSIENEAETGFNQAETELYTEEVKTGCTTAMLQCLDAESRLIFIMGNILSFSTETASRITGLSSGAYRKKLSRAREKIRRFMNGHCGLLNKQASCRCRRRIHTALKRGRLNPEKLIYQTKSPVIRQCQAEMNEIDKISGIFRGNPFSDKKELFHKYMKKNLGILSDNIG